MNPMLLQAEVAQLRQQVLASQAQTRSILYMLGTLARSVIDGVSLPMVDGKVCIKVADIEAMSKTFDVGVGQTNVKAPDAPEDDKGENVIVVSVTLKAKEANGQVLAAPSAPRLIVP